MFLHIFVIPVVASSSITGVGFVDIVFFIVDISPGFTTTLKIIFCYKITLPFYDIQIISKTCINTSIYMFICETDIL